MALPVRLALNSPVGSASIAPRPNVILTLSLNAPPVHRMPPPARSHTGTPAGLEGFFHFIVSTTSGSASRISARSRASVSPRQSPIAAI